MRQLKRKRKATGPEIKYADRPLLTKPEAMRWLRISRQTLDKRIKEGRYLTNHEGAREKVVTKSILNDIEASAQAGISTTQAA